MTRLPVPGADDNTWGQILNDYLGVSHNTDGTLKTNAVSTSQIADASVTPAKLSASFIPQSEKAVANGVATLDGSGLVPSSQLPPAGATPDATTTSKGIVQLAGDLGGTAASPTVPGLANKVSTSALGAASGVATLDGNGILTGAQAPLRTLPYSVNGPLAVKTGAIRLYNDGSAAWTIKGVRASVGSAPTGASIIVDVKVNGTTIFTTQANRPTIVAGGNTSGNVTNMDVTNVASGAYLTVDIAQVGSTYVGSDLCVQVEVQ